MLKERHFIIFFDNLHFFSGLKWQSAYRWKKIPSLQHMDPVHVVLKEQKRMKITVAICKD